MHPIFVWNMIRQIEPLNTRYDTTYMHDRYLVIIHIYVSLFGVKKQRVGIIASLTLIVTLRGHPKRGMYRANLS